MIFTLCFITLHMLVMCGAMLATMIQFGGKVDGDKDRIYIVDNVDILTDSEEQDVLELFEKVYDKSGMPITLWTDDYEWKDHYYSLEVYSEELYYGIGMDEDAMIILFTVDGTSDWYDWEYDIYCGDDTVKCFSDQAFDKLLANFQKAMSGQDLEEALEYSWESVMDMLAKTEVSLAVIPMLIFLLCFYGIFYFAIFGGVKTKNDAYRYFKENPEKLSNTPMTLYSECPNCGASNATQNETCPYCGSLLKISDGKVQFVAPKE